MKKRVMALLVHNKTRWVGLSTEADAKYIHKVVK
jgi:hypothetical protein